MAAPADERRDARTEAPVRSRLRVPGWASRHPGVVAAAAYLGCSLVLFHRLLGGLSDRMAHGNNSDLSQMAWFLSWMPHALLTGHNPLVTHAINVPSGANLMWNTSMPLAGLVMSPVTLTLGPLASLNLLLILGPALTAVTGRWWLCRHVDSEPARFVGGLMVGFGFFVNAHLGGHLNFELIPLAPVMLRLAEDVLWRAAGRTRLWAAVGLGAATAGQALMSEEIVVIVVVGAFLATVLAILNAPRTVLPAIPPALPGLGVALGTAAVLLAIPLYVQLYGPNIIDFVPNAGPFTASPRDLLVPSSRFLISLQSEDTSLYARSMNPAEDVVYLGLPMLVVLAVVAVRWRRQWTVRVAVLTAVLGFLLALGSGLNADGSYGWSRPAAALFHLPIFHNVLPVRFGLVIELACAWVLALVVEAGVRGLRTAGRSSAAGVAPLVACALVVVSLLPASPAEGDPARVPSYFTSDAVTSIPSDALVALLPPPSDAGTHAMLYQAMAGQRFWMLGSYARSNNREGWYDTYGWYDPISAIAGTAQARKGGIGSMTEEEVAGTHLAMGQLGVRYVIVVPADDPTGVYVRALRKIYGAPTEVTGGVQVWKIA